MPLEAAHPHRPRAALVLLAAGSSSRVGHETSKVFLPLAGRRVFTWSFRWAGLVPAIAHRLLVIAERDRQLAERALAREVAEFDVELVVGGDTRHESELHALRALSSRIGQGDIDVVVIHDAARPLAGTVLFDAVVDRAHRHGGALPVRPQPALVLAQPGGGVLDGVGGVLDGGVVAVQTPQAFRAAPLLAAYEQAEIDGFAGTDTASCIERYSDVHVQCIDGPARNIKITFPEDLFLAEHLLAQAQWDLTTEPEQRT